MLKSGIHRHVSMADYLDDPCERPSLTAGIAHTLTTRSSLHAMLEHPRLNSEHAMRQADEFDLGTAAHALLLEGADIVSVCEFDDWRKKDAQAAKADARQQGKIPLLSRQYARVQKMVSVAQEFMKECELSTFLLNAQAENTCIWQDAPESRFWFRSRPDLMSADRSVLVNYKTTESAEPNTFIRRMVSLGYDLSAAFYEWGMRSLGHEAQEFFLAQETQPPYACSLIGLDPAMREIAERKRDFAVTMWKSCLSNNRWLGYSSRIHYAAPTSWQIAESEELSMDDKIELGMQA